MQSALFVIATIGLAHYGACAAPSQVDDGVCAVQMMVEKKEVEKPADLLMPATNTTPTLSCPTTATIYNYDVTFDYELLYTDGEVSGATFVYTLTPSPSPQYAWRYHDDIKWWMPRCTCDVADCEFVEVSGTHEHDIGFTEKCDDSKQPAHVEFRNIVGHQKRDVYKAKYTLTSSNFMIGSIFMEIDPSYSLPHSGSICGPVCGFNLECVDSPNPWTSKGGQGCGHYAQNQWCTQSGGYGPNWNSKWGTFSTYAPTGGQGADEACCVCGGGSTAGCKDEPAGWVDSHHEGCDIYEKKDYCTYTGEEGPGWNSKWGKFEHWAKKGIDASEACCTCGGGKNPAPGPTKKPTKRPTKQPTKQPTKAPTVDDECEDDPVGWIDSYKEGCDIYEKKDYCTSSGGFGTGWNSKWGKFEHWAKKGIDATEACCTCGGGKNSPTKRPTANPTRRPTPSPTTASPTASPTLSPTTASPTVSPTRSPTTASPTASPTRSPTTASPTASPTRSPTTASPTASPTPSSATPSPTPGFDCPYHTEIWNYNVSFDYEHLAGGKTRFIYTWTPRSSDCSWGSHAFKWQFFECSCRNPNVFEDEEVYRVDASGAETPIGLTRSCFESGGADYLWFHYITSHYGDVYRVKFTVKDADVEIDDVEARIWYNYYAHYYKYAKGDICGPICSTGSPTKAPTKAPTEEGDCEDDPVGWKDSYKEGCDIYEKKDYCTSSGGFGTGWNTKWGKFEHWAKKGIDATEACCTCGGGKPTPTKQPTVNPTRKPTPSPTGSPTLSPTTPSPTAFPTRSPTTASPTESPTPSPTASPTESPTPSPTASPTASPTPSPTSSPTESPTPSPTASPTESPTKYPTTASPTESPTKYPTTASPTESPTKYPTTASPTESPTKYPTTASPTESPTKYPTTASPTESPTKYPTTASPTASPTKYPTTASPTASPTPLPTASPTPSPPTASPTASPTKSPTTAAPTPAPCPPPSRACEWPAGTLEHSLITIGNAHINAKNTYTNVTVGGDLITTTGVSKVIDGLATVEGYFDSNGAWNLNANPDGKIVKAPFTSVFPEGWAAFEDLARRLVQGVYYIGDVDYYIFVATKGGSYHLFDFHSDDDGEPLNQGENNGRTLVVFNTNESITLVATPDEKRKFGPSVLAPFSHVTKDFSSDFIDGFLIAKEAYVPDSDTQMHGDSYRGPLHCTCP